MDVTMPTHILQTMLSEAAEMGANTALAKAGLITPYISKSQAYKMYGESVVDRWIKAGLINPKKDGNHSSKWRISRQEIEAVAKANNRPSYAMVKERK